MKNGLDHSTQVCHTRLARKAENCLRIKLWTIYRGLVKLGHWPDNSGCQCRSMGVSGGPTTWVIYGLECLVKEMDERFPIFTTTKGLK